MGYWENRQAQAMYEYMEDAEKVSHEIADIYAKASTHISLKIDRIYKKFKDKNNLTDKDAIKLLNTLKDRTDIGELKKALKKSQNTALLAEIESGAYRARIEKLENLQTEIDRMMQQVFEQEKKVTTSHYVDLATNSYYREIYNVQRQVGFQFSFSAVDPEAVNMLLKSKWSGLNYSERIWKNTQNLARDVKEQMTIGLLTGKRQEEMAREIAIRYATGAFEARRLVRTESNFVNGQMQLVAYEECGAEKYEFVATLDLRTSAQCRELDGKVFLVKDAMPGNNMNPMHPFCRSTTIIHLDDTVLEGLQRRARNPITGENELVPTDLNYQEWYKNSVFNNSKAQNAEQIIKNRSYDKKQFGKYKEVIGNNVGMNLVNFQQMKYNEPEKFSIIKLDYERRTELLKDHKKKLPNAENAILPEGKFTKYLLGGDNEKGLAKGRAFTSRLGYSLENWRELQKEIQQGIEKYPAENKGQIEYGTRYEQKMILYGKNGTPANVIVGWLVKPDGTVAMTSAYIKEVTNK